MQPTWPPDRAATAASREIYRLAIEMRTATDRVGITELIDIPSDRVVPIPHLPPAVMGVYNWRGKILWMVDLAALLGASDLGATHPDRRCYQTIAISSSADSNGETRTIGLVVDEIADIEWCELQLSDPDPTAPFPWIKGHAFALDGERLTVLDELAILDRADIHADI